MESTTMHLANKRCLTCLPQDMIELILVRLSVSNLLRCRGVCKLWDGIIRDPRFTMAHLRRNAKPRPLLIFHRAVNLGKLCPSEAVLFDEAWSPSTWDVPVIEPDDFLCASCNGLICLYSSKSTIKIANVATGECMHLAKPVKNSKGDRFSYYNFGFSPATNEYKVMHFSPDKQLHGSGFFSEIQVYTLGNERWRIVRTPQALSLNCVEHSGVVNVNGAMYWLTEDTESSWRRAVVSFDLKDEHIELIRLPVVDFENPAFGYPFRYRIMEIDEKVSVAAVQTRRDSYLTGKMQIWTLDNLVEQSWSQKYNIELLSLQVLGLYGDKIVMHSLSQHIYCHELASQSFTVEIAKLVKLLDFSPRRDDNMQSYVHVKSLVRLDAYKKAGIVCMPKRKEGWKLKKWEVWEHKLSRLEKQWRRTYEMQRRINVNAQVMGVALSLNLPAPPDQDTFLQRLNWVEQKRVEEMLSSCLTSLEGALKVIDKALTASKKMIMEADPVKEIADDSATQMIVAADQVKGKGKENVTDLATTEDSDVGPSRPERRKPSSRFDQSTWTT
uniref:Uncharacterized protein n=1 Tax=Avena sativa TaxID=4498 RepID=A0ACD5Y160_AVESA